MGGKMVPAGRRVALISSKELIVWLGGETAGSHRQARTIKSLFLLRHVKVIGSPSTTGVELSKLLSTCTPECRQRGMRNE